MLTREKALKILHEHIKNKNLLRHCFAVEASMKTLAKYLKGDKDLWGLVGLLHDGDWEETSANPKTHTKKMVEWLKENGETNTKLQNAILSHNYMETKETPPKTLLEWSVFCCDELTGFIVAVTLVMPDKKIQSVTVESVIKKMKSHSFASNVNREQIIMCEDKLNIKLPEFIKIVLNAMQNISNDLGL